MNAQIERVNKAIPAEIPEESWNVSKAYRFWVQITKDEENLYSAVALNLPGVGSCGETEEEAIENFRESAKAALETYTSSNKGIPWIEKDAIDPSLFEGKRKWIMVNA